MGRHVMSIPVERLLQQCEQDGPAVWTKIADTPQDFSTLTNSIQEMKTNDQEEVSYVVT